MCLGLGAFLGRFWGLVPCNGKQAADETPMHLPCHWKEWDLRQQKRASQRPKGCFFCLPKKNDIRTKNPIICFFFCGMILIPSFWDTCFLAISAATMVRHGNGKKESTTFAGWSNCYLGAHRNGRVQSGKVVLGHFLWLPELGVHGEFLEPWLLGWGGNPRVA